MVTEKTLKMLHRLKKPRELKKKISLLSLFGVFGLLSLILPGCQPSPSEIPGLAKEHPAQKFYQFVSQNMVSDKVCRDDQGDPGIPMGEIAKGEKYLRTPDLVPGVFRFSDKTTGKKYLGVSFLQYQGFLQVPKLCSWEEADQKQA